MATDVIAVLNRERTTKTLLLGVSLGGMIAQGVASRYPDRIDRLVSVRYQLGMGVRLLRTAAMACVTCHKQWHARGVTCPPACGERSVNAHGQTPS
jgi:pimeloyl-ACP methyl ester carboxylesterase